MWSESTFASNGSQSSVGIVQPTAMLAAMNEVPIIRLAANGRYVHIALHSRPYPTSSEPWDRDAITATVSVRAGAFYGEVATMVWSHELLFLARLLLQLYEQIGHSTHEEFCLMDGAVSLTFELSKIGHVRVQVQAHEMGVDAFLTFSIDADQTYLPIWRGEIMQALEQFPPEV